MKIQRILILFLMISLSYLANYSFLIIPAVSSSNLPLDSASTIGSSAPDPVTIANFPSNITIRGNLNLTGNSVFNLAGVSSSVHVNVYLYGSIFINDNATLNLEHATLYLMGATKPYSRNITLSSSNGHPRLNITDASIIAGAASSKSTYSYAAAIYAYNKSTVTATQLSLSRQKISTTNPSLGGFTEIGCYGDSSVFLNSIKVESMFTYDEANVTVYGGTFAHSLRLYNSSATNLYGVTFPNTVVADDAHLTLAHCKEASSSILTSMGHSRLDIINGTTLTSGFAIVSGVAITVPGLNITGNSKVYFLSDSTISALLYGGTVISVYDNATFVEHNAVIGKGAILALDNSSVLFNNTLVGSHLQNIEIIGNDSSSVSISSCTLTGTPQPISIDLSGTAHLRIFNSSITTGYLVFSDNSTAYVLDTAISLSSRIIAQDNATLTVADGSNIANSIEMKKNARLSFESSSVILVYCPDSSQASFVNGSVTELSVGDNSKVHLMNSTVQELSLAESNVSGSLSGLTRFLENSTLTLLGSRSQVNVLNTTINGLGFSFSGNSNVTISNSILRNLSLQGSSVVTLKNASASSGFSVLGNSIVHVYTPLRVRCVDGFGNPLNGSVVTVNIVSGAAGGIESGTTDKSGWASFVFLSELVNATGSFPLGFVTVTGSYEGASKSTSFSVALIRKDVTLSLPLPWWSGYIIPVLVLIGIVALLVLIYYAYKRFHARK